MTISVDKTRCTGCSYCALICPEGAIALELEDDVWPRVDEGRCTRKDYAITTAAWTCPGPNSRIGRLCNKLGASIDWVTVHDVGSRGEHWVVMKDGRRFASTDEA